MLKKIINRALELGFSDYQIVVTEDNTNEINLFRGNVEKNFTGMDTTYYLKGIINNKLSVYTLAKNNCDLTDEEIDDILLKQKENVLSINSKDVFSIFEGSKEYPKIPKKESNIGTLSVEDRINLLKKLESSVYKYDSRIELVAMCEFVEETNKLRIVNSKGLDLSNENQYFYVILQVVAGSSKEDPNKVNNFEVKIGINVEDYNEDEFVEKVCKELISKIGASPVESKVYPVIMDKSAMASLLGGFFMMFSGESLLRGLTGLKGRTGEKIVSEMISIVDDPLDEKSFSQQAFDLEGVATSTKKVVDKGVFKMFLHNLKTATACGTESTGNASMNGITPQNFHIENGETPIEEVIGKVKEGLLIKDLMGLHAGLNPISGDFSCQSAGYLIKDGKIERPVTLIVVSGNFLKMLSEVEAVASDFEYSYTGFGSPSVLFKGLPISGK